MLMLVWMWIWTLIDSDRGMDVDIDGDQMMLEPRGRKNIFHYLAQAIAREHKNVNPYYMRLFLLIFRRKSVSVP